MNGAERYSAEEIQRLLSPALPETRIVFLDTVDSTNTEARRRIDAGETAPCLIVAREQEAGRGRFGRQFYSPKDTGLYMTLLLPAEFPAELSLCTVAAAVAVCRGIDRLCGTRAEIKWVNDILLEGAKVCGILCEMHRGALITGIGVNVSTELFPPDLPFAGTLPGAPDRAALAAEILGALYEAYRTDRDTLISAYRERSCLLGQEIRYTRNGETHSGTAVAIDGEGRLLVEKNGQTTALSSGEVSLGSGRFAQAAKPMG